MAEERTPAGWYPDPSGLPQLRWWDNHKWTEFVSDSQLDDDTADVAARAGGAAAFPGAQAVGGSGAHAASHSAAVAAEHHTATGYAAEHSAAAHVAAQAARPMPEPTVPEPAVADHVARGDSGPGAGPSTAPDLRSAFDAMFTEPAPASSSSREPSLVEAFDQTFGYATPGVPDPAEALFAASVTSPIGVGTGETIGEALMRALQSA